MVVNRERSLFDHVMAAKAPHFGDQRARHSRRYRDGYRWTVLSDRSPRAAGECDTGRSGAGRDRPGSPTAISASWGGRGEKAAIRARIGLVKQELRATSEDDAWSRERVKERIGKLAGLAAQIKVGAATASARDELKLRVEAAVTFGAGRQCGMGWCRAAGAALVTCVPAVQALDLTGDEAVGARILARALSEPMRALARNAGLDPSTIVEGGAPARAEVHLRRDRGALGRCLEGWYPRSAAGDDRGRWRRPSARPGWR